MYTVTPWSFGQMPSIGEVVPDFTVKASDPDRGGAEMTVNMHAYCRGHWTILFSHPADFTPVCTTELAAAILFFHKHKDDSLSVIALSTDSIQSHQKWIKDIERVAGMPINFPIIADDGLAVSRAYGMLPADNNVQTVRTVYFIDPDIKLAASISYPMAVGRSFGEIERVLMALKKTKAEPVACPADWQDGQPCIVRLDVSDEEALARYPSVRKTDLSYLRYTQ